MKKAIIIAMVLAFNLSNAQVDSLWTITKVKDAAYKSVDKETKHVLEFEGKTANELYNSTRVAIGSLWKNPDEVIAGEVDNQYIKVNGGATSVAVSSLGAIYYFNTRVSITFKFKDNKMMYQITNQETYTSPSEYTSGGWSSTMYQVTRRNGKRIIAGFDAVTEFELFVQGIENAIIKEVESLTTNEGW
tara:strand:+ start:5589 stop:6155 length:567 start_codon:yes stop_codon:yes gene_type:complete